MRRSLAFFTPVVGALALAPAAADAASWSPIASGTTNTITAIEYQSPTRFWFTTSAGEIFTRQAGGSFARTFGPSGVMLKDIEFQDGTGPIGLAVGDNGTVLRSADGGASWNTANPGSSPIDVSAPGCTSPAPLGVVESVHFAADDDVWIIGSGAQMARSEGPAAVGAVGTWFNANLDDGVIPNTCLVPASADLGDAFFPATGSAVFCTTHLGEVYATTDDLATAAIKRPAACGPGNVPRRITGVKRTSGRMWAIGRGDGVGSARLTTDNWATSAPWPVANAATSPATALYDVASEGGMVVAVGDAGLVLLSDGGSTFGHHGADGALASTNWRASGVATVEQAAIGGSSGALAITDEARHVADVTAPTVTIDGVGNVVVGQSVTLHVAVEDADRTIPFTNIAWSVDGQSSGFGRSARVTFRTAGSKIVRVDVQDRAGNVGTATATVDVQPAPAQTLPPPPPKPKPKPKPVTYTQAKTFTRGVARITIYRRVVLTGRSPRVVPVKVVSKSSRTFRLTLTRKGAKHATASRRTVVKGTKTVTLAFPAKAKTGIYTLSVTVLKRGKRTGAVVRQRIVIV